MPNFYLLLTDNDNDDETGENYFFNCLIILILE